MKFDELLIEIDNVLKKGEFKLTMSAYIIDIAYRGQR